MQHRPLRLKRHHEQAIEDPLDDVLGAEDHHDGQADQHVPRQEREGEDDEDKEEQEEPLEPPHGCPAPLIWAGLRL